MTERLMSIKWWLAGAAVAAAAVTWLMADDDAGERIVYSMVEIKRGDIVRIVTASGQLRALITVEVGSQLSGQIAELGADFNSEVKAGDVIARIDPKTFEARVRQSRAEHEVARANLAIQEAAQAAEEASLREARRDFERKRELAAKGHTSQSEFDRARAELEGAEARVVMAKAQVVNAEAVIKQRRASLFQAEIDLDRTQIRAPVDGVVIERNVDVGQTVAASLSSPVLFRIAQDLRNMQVEANIDEADIGNLREGNQVEFTVDAYPGREFTGSVRQIRKAPIVSENVVTYTAVVATRNDDLRLLPGMTADIEIVTGRRRGVLRVDNSALRFRPRGGGDGAGAEAGGGMSGAQLARGMTRRLTRGLDLSTEQQSALEEALAKRMPSRGAAEGNGGDPSRRFAQIGAALENILADILTTEQMAAYRKSRGHAGGEFRRGVVWFEDDDGRLARASVRLGISDDNYTEIVDGDVKAGDQVIARARTLRDGAAAGTRR